MNYLFTDKERDLIDKIQVDIANYNKLGISNRQLGVQFSPVVRDIVVSYIRDTLGVYTEYMQGDNKVNYIINRKR